MSKKKILSSFLIISMMISLLPLTIFGTEGGEGGGTSSAVQMQIIPDKETAHPGDTITYTVKMGAVNNLGGMQFQLVIPDKLTFVPFSSEDLTTIRTGLNTTFNITGEGYQDITGFDNDTKILRFVGGSYSSNETTSVLTFSCTVNQDALGENEDSTEVSVSFNPAEGGAGSFGLCSSSQGENPQPAEDIAADITNLGSAVTITKSETPAPSYKIGDVNNDGRINSRDVKLLFDYVSSDGTDSTSANYVNNVDNRVVDINNDGRINSRDVKLLFDYVSSDGTDPTSAAYIDNQQ